jgi:hypothetical protein
MILRIAGGSQIVLGLAHVLIWRRLGWTAELRAMTPLTARVFTVHTFFIAFVLVAFGTLELVHPELLASPLGRFLLGGSALFWSLRLVAQPVVFDPVLLVGSPWRTPLRIAATALFAAYVGVYVWALWS